MKQKIKALFIICLSIMLAACSYPSDTFGSIQSASEPAQTSAATDVWESSEVASETPEISITPKTPEPSPTISEKTPEKSEAKPSASIKPSGKPKPSSSIKPSPKPSSKPSSSPKKSASKPKPSEKKEKSSPKKTGTVYWTPSGAKYHSRENCRTLARSKKIYSGSISQAEKNGKHSPCKVCS